MIGPCETREQIAQPVLMMRTRTPAQGLPAVLGQCYGKIWTHMVAVGGQPGGAPYVAYFNMDMNDLDLEIGFPVNGELPGQGEVQAGALPAGKVATILFTGPYPSMADAYNALNEYMQANALQPTGTVYEFYLNDPAQTPPERLQTQIVFPLK